MCTLSYMSRNSPGGVKLKHPELIAAGLAVAARDNIILSVLNDSLHTSNVFVSQKIIDTMHSVVCCSGAQYAGELLTFPSTILFCSSSEQSQQRHNFSTSVACATK